MSLRDWSSDVCSSGLGFVDGSGGVAIVEVDSFSTLGRAIAPFTSWMRFTTIPIVPIDRKSTRLNSSHVENSYAVFCLKKKKLRTCQFIGHIFPGLVLQ